MMRCYLAAGKRPAALAQFHRCREILQQELQVEPMPETWLLYRQMQENPAPGLASEIEDNCPASLQASLAQFRHTLNLMESAWQSLKRHQPHAPGAARSQRPTLQDPTAVGYPLLTHGLG